MADIENKDIEMNEEEYEPEIVELDGEPFEVIDGLTFEDTNYIALVPYTEDDSDEDAEFVILKEVEENGEYFLATIDDDDLYSRVGDMFLEKFDALFEGDLEELDGVKD